MEKVFVYILRLDNKGYYTGLTNNIERRLSEHRKAKRGYTARFKTKDIIFIYECDNRKQARKIEVLIKKTGAKRFLIRNEKGLREDGKLKLFRK